VDKSIFDKVLHANLVNLNVSAPQVSLFSWALVEHVMLYILTLNQLSVLDCSVVCQSNTKSRQLSPSLYIFIFDPDMSTRVVLN
jgi:hypothetical protein